jgi:hypothetical protein
MTQTKARLLLSERQARRIFAPIKKPEDAHVEISERSDV